MFINNLNINLIEREIYSPLELFNITVLYNLYHSIFDLSITNYFIYIFISSNIILFLSYNNIIVSKDSFIKLDNFKYIFYNLYEKLYVLILDILTLVGNKYIILLINLFIFILINNIIGLVPYAITTTSQFIITLLLSNSIIIGVTLIGIINHKFKFVYLFIPKGVPSSLLPLISFIEIISYLSRIISLSLRLAANMIAGHTILFIISSFNLFLFISLPILILIYILEIGVSIIQAFVFTILTTTYIKNSIELH